jgi:uncharacterized protein YecT (DUF1311 family)
MDRWKLAGLIVVATLAACSGPSNSQLTTSAMEVAPQAKGATRPPNSPPVATTSETELDFSRDEATGKGVTAQKHGDALRDSYYKCASSSDGSTWDMQGCVEVEFEYQDARLNLAYRSLRSKLPIEKQDGLRDDERRWLSEKDAACKWDAQAEGQAQRVEANICSLKKTAERASQLEQMLRGLTDK